MSHNLFDSRRRTDQCIATDGWRAEVDAVMPLLEWALYQVCAWSAQNIWSLLSLPHTFGRTHF